jgi:hypothetical protein
MRTPARTVRFTDEEMHTTMEIARDVRRCSDDADTLRIHAGIYDACQRAALSMEHERSRIARVRPQRTGVR